MPVLPLRAGPRSVLRELRPYGSSRPATRDSPPISPPAHTPPAKQPPVAALAEDSSFARLADEQGLRPIYLNPVVRRGQATAKAGSFARKEAERRIENEMERVRKLDILAAQLRSQGKKIFVSKTGVILSEGEATALTKSAAERESVRSDRLNAAADKASTSSASQVEVEQLHSAPDSLKRQRPLSELVAQLPTQLPPSRPMTPAPSEQLATTRRPRSAPPGPPPKRESSAAQSSSQGSAAAFGRGQSANVAFDPLQMSPATVGRFAPRRDSAIWGAASLPVDAPTPVAIPARSLPSVQSAELVTGVATPSVPPQSARLPLPRPHRLLSTGPFFTPALAPLAASRTLPTLEHRLVQPDALPAELVSILSEVQDKQNPAVCVPALVRLWRSYSPWASQAPSPSRSGLFYPSYPSFQPLPGILAYPPRRFSARSPPPALIAVCAALTRMRAFDETLAILHRQGTLLTVRDIATLLAPPCERVSELTLARRVEVLERDDPAFKRFLEALTAANELSPARWRESMSVGERGRWATTSTVRPERWPAQ